MKNDQHDIFEDLQHLLALDYLSDLRFHPYRKEAERLLAHLDLTKYPLCALCEIAEYLFSKKNFLFHVCGRRRIFCPKDGLRRP